jgi:DNA primase
MMRDLRVLKASHDLRRIVEADLGSSRLHGSGAWVWQCPFHQERHGYSLAVWPDHWMCFGKCQEHGDVFDWLRRYRELDFIEACELLSGETLQDTARAQPARSRVFQLPNAEPPPERWQRAAQRITALAERSLWSTEGLRARRYLYERGLSEATILAAGLGYLSGLQRRWHNLEGLKVPAGILIPWCADGHLWSLKVRRSAGPPKYTQVAGGSSGGLYGADSLAGHRVALFVEGEFDALLAEQAAGDLVAVVTLGSAVNTLHQRWYSLLAGCSPLLVAYDADEAGRKGAAKLSHLTRRARVVQVPRGKDITEFVLQGGDLRQWLKTLLED